MNRYTSLLMLLSATLLLTSCDALGVKSTLPKCDDLNALELTANLIRSNSGMPLDDSARLFGVYLSLIADHSLATTEMILNRGVNREVGKTYCVASFVFTDPITTPTTDTCKYVSRTEYELQHDTTGQLVSTITKVGTPLCVKFSKEEVTSFTINPTDASRQFELGLKYVEGRGVPKNDAEAVKWFRKAADQGLASAQYNLGVLFAKGLGVAENDAEAAKWWRKAAEQGNTKAQYNLGYAYSEGEGVEENDAEADKWFRLAAKQEHGTARAYLDAGVRYYDGDGVSKDYAEAVKQFRVAAEQGSADAQSFLGSMYDSGEGVAENDAEAVKWYRLAADQGYGDAQLNLGNMYAFGEGIPRDIVTARDWWDKAVSGNADDAQKSYALFVLGESFYAGEKFGSIDDIAQAKIFWEMVIEVGMTTEQSHKLASAGLACIERGESSKDCQPLRCSIEGRSDCPDL